MINKILQSGYNDSNQFPTAAVIPSFGDKLDRQTLKKRASIFDNDYELFEKKPGHTYIHLISVAAGEQYGPNSRADFYNGDSYRHDFPQPKAGGPSFIILKPGLAATHNKTFMEHGGVYTEHVSSLDGAKPQGYIVKAAVNPEMKRGELIIGVETDKWSDDIHMLESGKPMKFSIGASAPYDICSICGNIATTEEGHCDHYKSMPGEFTADGDQVYVISDNCLFHDISRVKRPAEKIAFSIRKVASQGSSRFHEEAIGPNNPSVIRALCKTATAKRRFDTLCKLAAIEKEIIAEVNNEQIDPGLISYFKSNKKGRMDSVEALAKFLNVANESQIVGSCNKCGYIMSPEEFVSLMLPDADKCGFNVDMDEVRSLIPGIFGKILHSTDADSFCNDTTYEVSENCTPIVHDQISRHCKSNSIGSVVGNILDKYLEDGCLKNSPDKIIITISNGVGRDTSSTIAEDYASYLTSAAENMSPGQLAMSMLTNII